MASTAPSYFDRKPSGRPGLAHLQDPTSPHTPQRNFSSALSSPSLSYRVEEESIIFELGNRHLSAGFAGEGDPRCTVGFGPEESRRVGDYRRWLPGYDDRPRKRRKLSTLGDDHELWRMDLRGFDLGIVADKVERAVREAYTRSLLLDSKSRKVCLVLPSVLPHQLLNTILCTLFENFAMPSITLLSPAILSTLAGGCRSGLLVDIGWRETILTTVYDYREICQWRTVRGARNLVAKTAQLLERSERVRKQHPANALAGAQEDDKLDMTSVDLDQAEEVTARMVWCRPPRHDKLDPDEQQPLTVDPNAETGDRDDRGSEAIESSPSHKSDLIDVPSPSAPRQSIQIPFSSFADVAEDAFFANAEHRHTIDDHEQPLPQLIFKCLLSLPPDIRSTVMSRIMFTGGACNIPGLKPRIIEELKIMIQQRGFDPVLGKAADERKRRVQGNIALKQSHTASTPTTPTAPEPKKKQPPASEAPQIYDEIDLNLEKERAKHNKPEVRGVVRGVETLGAWAGASLLSSLRIKGIVDIEKDVFLQYGLAGAKREADVSAAPPRKSYGGEIGRSGIGERASWTLGAWA